LASSKSPKKKFTTDEKYHEEIIKYAGENKEAAGEIKGEDIDFDKFFELFVKVWTKSGNLAKKYGIDQEYVFNDIVQEMLKLNNRKAIKHRPGQ
jgi:hypothetical protein